jgi:hypothetical protein
MAFPPKAASASLAADPDAAGDLAVSPAVKLGGGKNPSKKNFGGPRTMTAGGGGGSKFGGFRKGGGVANFKGGRR